MRSPVAALTGGTGFLGRHIAHALAARGWHLRLLVRQQSIGAVPDELAAELVIGGLEDADAVQRLVGGADVVIHAAGLIKARHDSAYWTANLAGTEHVAKMMRHHAPRSRMVLISSLAARAPTLSPYAASKRAAEQAALAALGERAIAILRSSAVYGPGDRETLRIFRAASGPLLVIPREPARISLLYASDLATAVTAAAQTPELRGIYEVTDQQCGGYSWLDIVDTARNVLGVDPPLLRIPTRALRALSPLLHLRRWYPRASILTPEKLREILHDDWSSSPAAQLPPSIWSAHIDLQAGFRQTVGWYLEQGWLSGPATARNTAFARDPGQRRC